ncbi:hypothetical protein D9757_003838 [Collybiopsis confluens]|uniref:Adenine DNA glycosylase n=1 Tax=Collybiopsis confluens TaxID=2823264 RepID=A0A8H5HV20_9AGAR|nr:hypothetical protein D9757_003838 [Collybiopsis confluens]
MTKRRRALVEDESDYTPGTSKLSKRRRHARTHGTSSPNTPESECGERTRVTPLEAGLEDKNKNCCDDVDVDEENSSKHSKMAHVLSNSSLIRQALLEWYVNVRASRGMPWRKPFDPSLDLEGQSQRAYEVWALMSSEIMLQQTQVATVIPYYNAWMNRFPTIQHLASSSLDEVNALWKGLGYYSRAKRLLTGAQKVVQEYQGRLPRTSSELEAKIPGIGRYSAGAISSIAYGERVPALDGNVSRLLSRLLTLHAPPKSKATTDVLWAAAAAIVGSSSGTKLSPSGSKDHSGDINEALIELGSTICRPSEPKCSGCPLSAWCGAYDETNRRPPSRFPDIEDVCTLCKPLPKGISGVSIYPMKAEKKKARVEVDIISVVEWRSSEDQKFLLLRRPDKGLLASLYEFPSVPNVSISTSEAEASDLAQKQLLSIFKDPLTPP